MKIILNCTQIREIFIDYLKTKVNGTEVLHGLYAGDIHGDIAVSLLEDDSEITIELGD